MSIFSVDTNEAKLALQILCLSFSGKGCTDMLTYIYEECDVSYVCDLAMCMYMYIIILCHAVHERFL